MSTAILEDLPDDPKALKALIIQQRQTAQQLSHVNHEQTQSIASLYRHEKSLERQILRLTTELAKLQEERRLDRARRFGASSEAGSHHTNETPRKYQSSEANCQ